MLLTIEEHNKRVLADKFKTGVACPNCGNELQFTTPGLYYCSSPLKADVKCFKCDYVTKIYWRCN